eukprot:390289-Hanusia_phi.AAC.1
MISEYTDSDATGNTVTTGDPGVPASWAGPGDSVTRHARLSHMIKKMVSSGATQPRHDGRSGTVTQWATVTGSAARRPGRPAPGPRRD